MDLEEQYDKIYRYCYFKVRHCQTAEDITQETFLRFFNKQLSLNSDKELPYLYTIARNLCIEEYRKGSKEKSCEINEELLLLRYANDVPIASICKITGLSRFAIYRKTARILKYLKTELQKGGFSDE